MEREAPVRLFAPRSVLVGRNVDHIAYRVADVGRSAAFYRDILGMRVLEEGEDRAALVFGSPPRVLRLARGDGSGVPAVDHFAIAVEEFEVGRVVDVLRSHRLDPRQHAEDEVTVRDPSGIVVGICPAGAEVSPSRPDGSDAASEDVSPAFLATAVNHIAFRVADVGRVRDFYIDLFGMRLWFEDGRRSAVGLGDPEDSLYITTARGYDGPGFVDHLAVSVADFDLAAAHDRLVDRGLEVEDDGAYAWSIWDPDGYKIQVCAEVGVYPGARRDPYHNP